MTGSIDQPGFINYINRDNLSEKITYEVPWSSSGFYKDVKKLQAARRRVYEDIEKGKFNVSELPQASSIEALELRDQQIQEDTLGLANRQDELFQKYQDEMDWLRSTRRNMPDALIEKNQKHYSHDSVAYKHKDRSWMGQTVGLSQHLHQNANNHHVY